MQTLALFCAVAASLAVSASPCHAQIYKCVQGTQTIFSDKPCTQGTEARLKAPVGIPQSDIQFDVVTTHYAVNGSNFSQVIRAIVSSNPGGFAGWARWQVDYHFDTLPRPEGCSVDRVYIKLRGQIMMPNWETLASATPNDQYDWRAMYAQLKRHEDGHVQNGRDFALLLRERLLGMGTVPCDAVQSSAQQVYRTLYTSLQNRDADYDRRTRHGVRQDNPE